ncbi:MAG: XisI protein [Caldilineaceae bacterium]
MEGTVEQYKKSVKQFLSTYESLHTEHLHVELLFDDVRLRYMAVRVGWINRKRIHLCLIHIEICDGFLIIQCNNTEDLIIDELEALGISRQKIILGFLPPEIRTLEALHEREVRLEPA